MPRYNISWLSGSRGPAERKEDHTMAKRPEVKEAGHQASFLSEIPTIVRERKGRQGHTKYGDLYARMAQVASGDQVALKMLFESARKAGAARSAVARYEGWAEYHSQPLPAPRQAWVTAVDPLAQNMPEGACWLYVWLEGDPSPEPIQIPKGRVD